MKQLSFKLDKPRKEHGGSLATRKRRSRRPLDTKLAHHITLKSNLATGGRCLRRHQTLIKDILYRSANRFNITVYQYAVAGNHLHLLVKGKSRIGIQNFFRVFAGHSAQEILRLYPLKPSERNLPGGASDTTSAPKPGSQSKPGGAPNRASIPTPKPATGGASALSLQNSKSSSDPQYKGHEPKPHCAKNQRKFWGFLIYSRVLSWGKEFKIVTGYIAQNSLEALGLIAYRERSPKKVLKFSSA